MRYNIDKLKDTEVMEQYIKGIEGKLLEQQEEERDIEEQWKYIKRAVVETAEVVLGRQEKSKKKEWFDAECEYKLKERNIARLEWMQRKTRASAENFKEKRREAKSVCKKAKREYMKMLISQIDEWDKNDTRKFYKRVKSFKRGFQPRTDFCKDKDGTLIGDKE